jgi:hypothetical protein
MIKLPRPQPRYLSSMGMTMQQFAELVCNTGRAQMLATINTLCPTCGQPTDQLKGNAK